jgi:hypothetical protein
MDIMGNEVSPDYCVAHRRNGILYQIAPPKHKGIPGIVLQICG